MTNISAVESGSPGRVASAGDSIARIGPRTDTTLAPRSADRADISPMAHLLSKLRAMPEVRQELIDEVRAKIEQGGYDTPEKLDQAMNEMISESEQF